MELKPRNEASVWPSLLEQKCINLLFLFRLGREKQKEERSIKELEREKEREKEREERK